MYGSAGREDSTGSTQAGDISRNQGPFGAKGAGVRREDTVWAMLLRRRGVSLILLTLLGAALLGAGATAKSQRPLKLKRCGYTTATYGRSALYPWHMSCAAAREVVKASDNPHAQIINFGPGWDGAAIRIGAHYWVCTGLMGSYECGYPYRPRKVDGSRGYRGPFTKDVKYETCSVIEPASSRCPKTVEFTQPQN